MVGWYSKPKSQDKERNWATNISYVDYGGKKAFLKYSFAYLFLINLMFSIHESGSFNSLFVNPDASKLLWYTRLVHVPPAS